jgi:hypothetical protein
LVPLGKQLLLQIQQLHADLTAGTLAFGDGREVADQVRPAQLPLLGGQVVVGGEAIAHPNAGKGMAQQLHRRGGRTAQSPGPIKSHVVCSSAVDSRHPNSCSSPLMS